MLLLLKILFILFFVGGLIINGFMGLALLVGIIDEIKKFYMKLRKGYDMACAEEMKNDPFWKNFDK